MITEVLSLARNLNTEPSNLNFFEPQWRVHAEIQLKKKEFLKEVALPDLFENRASLGF